MRLGEDPLRNHVEATAKILDAQGRIPVAPDCLGGKTLTALLASGEVNVTIDRKYPQAIGVNGIMERVGIWGNCAWDVIVNDHAHSSFFTSDFPAAIELSRDPRILNRLVPLAPDLAVRIRPDLSAKKLAGDFAFPAFRCRPIAPKHEVIRAINRATVQCAEELVFFRDQSDWVAPFLAKNRVFRLEPRTTQIPVDRGFMNISTMRIAPSQPQ